MPDIQLQHIKGHQDRERDYDRLPLLAQLNVDADAIANRYQKDYGSLRPDVLITQWAGVHLILATGTVTSHYKSAIRHHVSAAPLQEQLLNRNQWSQQTFKTINWSAHGKGIRAHIHRRTHYQTGTRHPSNEC